LNTSRPNDFGRQYHWPNVHLPSPTYLASKIQEVLPGKFVLYNFEDHGIRQFLPIVRRRTVLILQTIHARCVNGEGLFYSFCFVPAASQFVPRRLEKNLNDDIIKTLEAKHPALKEKKNIQAFIRKWQYMFAYAEVGFARAYTSLPCWTFTRPVI
jgi:cyclopropane-fatty-acyl-phospholipid synthase